MENKEYLILDFGKVVAGPKTGEWFITPNFFNIVSKDKIELEKLKEAIKKYSFYLSLPMHNEAEEFMCFSMFYNDILRELKYPVTDDVIEALADDWTFNDEKFLFYNNIKSELAYLKEKYQLLMLTDNWPSVLRIMHNNDTYVFFKKIYVSSIYEAEKKNGIFFDYPISEYELENRKVKFVDDDIINLEFAEKKGLTPIMMDRENNRPKVKYKTINSLFEL